MSTLTWTTKRLLALLIACLIVSVSCATQLDMTSERITLPGPEWGVVIGSVLVQPEADRQGTSAAGSNAARDTYQFEVVQIQPGDPEGKSPYANEYQLTAKTDEERVFISRLRPGQYLLRAFYEASMVGLGGALDVVVTVAPGEVRYVGRVRMQVPRRLSSGKDYHVTVENVRAQTLSQLSRQHAALVNAAVDGPMQVRVRSTP